MEESEQLNKKTEMEILQKFEDEHLMLQRQFRCTQVERANRTLGVHPLLRSRDLLARALGQEYLGLRRDLKIAKSGAHKKKDRKMKHDLKRALLHRGAMLSDCCAGIHLVQEMNGLLKKKGKVMLQLQKIIIQNTGEMEASRVLSERRLLAAENKLEAAVLRFNALQSQNRRIREEIEGMLKDREIFNKDWAHMLSILAKGKKFMLDLFESSTVAYDQRDDWCRKLRSLTEKGKMEQQQQMQEMRDLQQSLDNETKIYEFLSRKGTKRVNLNKDRHEKKKKAKEEEEQLKEIERLSNILEEIYKETGLTDVEKIIQQFNYQEQNIHSIYLLVTDICAENVFLTKDLEKLRQDILVRAAAGGGRRAARGAELAQLRAGADAAAARVRRLRGRTERRAALVKTVIEGVMELFRTLNCSVAPYENLLGDKSPASPWLIATTLAAVSEAIQRKIELSYYYERQMQKKSERPGTSRLKKYTVRAESPEPRDSFHPTQGTADPCPSCVEARWLARVTDTPEAPFDREMALAALQELNQDAAYERSDRVHVLTECRLPRSRLILARRYV